jgi:hypothetical protein
MRKKITADARDMQLQKLRLIGMFSLLLICAAAIWSGRVSAAQTPQAAGAVFDASAGMQLQRASDASAVSKDGLPVTLLPFAGGRQ